MIPLSVFLILTNLLMSWKGFRDPGYLGRFAFSTDGILVHKQYYRLVTGGFLHAGWGHLIWNMIALYAFSSALEGFFGPFEFLAVYFAGLIGGSLLSLFLHRAHSGYKAIGASGAVCGVIFASIGIFPGLSVQFFFVPFQIPGWLFGLVFTVYSIYGIRSRTDNIGHDAHLGGAIIGMLTAIALFPQAIAENYPTLLLILVPAAVFMYLIVTRPHILVLGGNSFRRPERQYYSVDHRYNAEKADKQREVDRLLDKINRKGYNSLSKKEKETLRQHSKTFR